ncbi:MAG: FAD-dependent oxidoreductase [Negativicutes bacterium]|nr:FAD-dependent oxidoreductase [Negativicutes bacterium]
MYIIIGQGAAGTSAANRLRELDPATPVTVITSETDYFYSRIDLPDIIGGKYGEERSVLQPAATFAERGIACRMGETVTGIIPAEKAVELASGERLTYKKLLLATGSLPVIPPLAGTDCQGVHSVWTLEQARTMIQQFSDTRRAVVVGAGLIGLKTALAIAARGVEVTVVEYLPRVLPRQLDEVGSEMVAAKVRDKGVELLLGTKVEGFVTEQGRISGVRLAERVIGCDMVVMAVGVKPNSHLAVLAGLKTNRGVIVDEHLQTSDPDIYTAGDAAEVIDALTGKPTVPAIWPVAVEQGAVAAINMSGGKAACAGTIAMNSVEIAGVPIVSVGDIEEGPGDVRLSLSGYGHKKIVVRNDVVRGVLFVGDISQAGVAAHLVERRTQLPVDKLPTRSLSFAELLAI